MTDPNRFVPPWRVVELEGAYRIEDANGLAIGHLFFTEDPDQIAHTGRLSKDEARLAAARVVEISDFELALKQLRAEHGAVQSAARQAKR
ncbi:hypothetical protein J2X36_000449 [Methylobacterium sp. BE186]|uniref:hypothetical protein n=1 Tax=Methylobacterium sp. BE186 TaxID=2817715 RepID=UPI0028657295|nr:hypothetical protein [Methylobacterium sp. BE186]MDR7035713.1 hypothetical protein [Methylobacterium sp. BE186]